MAFFRSIRKMLAQIQIGCIGRGTGRAGSKPPMSRRPCGIHQRADLAAHLPNPIYKGEKPFQRKGFAMRMILRILAWLFGLAAVTRAALALYTGWLVAALESVSWDISVENLIADHIDLLNWAPDMARNIFPDHWVESVLGLPALLGLPLGAIIAAALSWSFFRLSRTRQ